MSAVVFLFTGTWNKVIRTFLEGSKNYK